MINCNIKSSEQIILRTKRDIQQKIFRIIRTKYWTIIIDDISQNSNRIWDWFSLSKQCYHIESNTSTKKQNSWFKIFLIRWKRRWKKMIECDQKRIRLLILSIDIKKRKYVHIQLKNSDSLNFWSEIFNRNENNALEDRISKKKNNVRVLH